MKPLLVTSGEPAGIGPDICLALAGHPIPLVVLANKTLLEARAAMLGLEVIFEDYNPKILPIPKPQHLTVWSIPCPHPVTPGVLDIQHVPYVINMLTLAVDACLAGDFSGLVTGPVHKEIINQAGVPFSGHTEFLATRCQVKTVVMLMVAPQMRLALATTHLPLRDVAAAITVSGLTEILQILHGALQRDFGLKAPVIQVAGLNPHAGEGGYLGYEERDVISPVIQSLQQQGMLITGPFSADTMFVPRAKRCDAYLAMYHDQGLPVVKYSGFEKTVNVTIGLPVIRTSVDHGTALSLAGSGLASAGSLRTAIDLAAEMSLHRGQRDA